MLIFKGDRFYRNIVNNVTFDAKRMAIPFKERCLLLLQESFGNVGYAGNVLKVIFKKAISRYYIYERLLLTDHLASLFFF